ncbi:MAG: FAD-linked oxidase C-terminal domain-containing protein [Solirubrobacteraceae bacterium]
MSPSGIYPKGSLPGVRELAQLIGSEHVLDARRLSDASESRGISGTPRALVRPGSAAEVAAVLAWCYAHDVALVPRGGATGFSGGAVPRSDAEIVLELARLDRVRSFEPGLWRINVEAGLRTAQVARLARESGLFVPPDPGAAEQSQIGGNIATNAGGPHAFKYGVTSRWVSGIEAALAPGELVRFGGPLTKDVAGYDLRALLCGSEGTLGIITAAWLRLLPAPAEREVRVAFYADARQGGEAVMALLASGAQPAALDFLDGGALHAARSGFPGEIPPGAGFALLCETDAPGVDVAEPLAQRALRVAEVDARRLWRWRDGVSIAVSAVRGGKLSEDISVPVERLAEAVEATVEIGRRHGLDACSWGHAGDGNLHSTFMLERAQAVRAGDAARELFELAASLGGSVSGEHGMGQVKQPLHLDAGARAAHARIKLALDPKNLLNPGKKRFSA